MTTTLENLSQHGVRWCVDFAPSAVDFPWAPSVGGSSAGGDIQRCLSDTGIDPVIRRPNRWPRQKRLCCFLMGTTAGWGADRTEFSSGRVTPLIVFRRSLVVVLIPIGPFRKPFSLLGGVRAARSRSGEDPDAPARPAQSRSHRINECAVARHAVLPHETHSQPLRP